MLKQKDNIYHRNIIFKGALLRMLISILVPVYKVEKYLVECLESVFLQTISNFELILVDDGSPDNSGKICDDYKIRYSTKVIVIHQQNRGLLAARRVAISYAKGDYCIFLDSDDILEPHCLQTITDLVKKNDVDIVLYNMNNLTSEGVIIVNKPVFTNGRIFYENKKDIYLELLGSHRLNNIFTKAIKTELLVNDPTNYIEFFSNSQGEDLLQSLYPITYSKSIIYCSTPLYNYRENPTSITHSYTQDTVNKVINKMLDKQLISYMKIWNMDQPEYYELLYLKRITNIFRYFIKIYRNCNTSEERMNCLKIDWFSFILPEILIYKNNKKLNLSKKVIMSLLENKKFILLKFVLLFI